jgi:hypothetical protein
MFLSTPEVFWSGPTGGCEGQLNEARVRDLDSPIGGGGWWGWAAIGRPGRRVSEEIGMASEPGYLEWETKLSANLGLDPSGLRHAAGRTQWLAEEVLQSCYVDPPDRTVTALGGERYAG